MIHTDNNSSTVIAIGRIFLAGLGDGWRTAYMRLRGVSETEVGSGMPESPVLCLGDWSPAWEGDPGGETNLAQICHSDTLFPAAQYLSLAVHHSLS